MFNSLQEKINSAIHNLKGNSRITELNIANTIKEIRRALIAADVNYKIAKEFTDNIKNKAIGEKVINSLNPSQLIVKIVHDELINLLGNDNYSLNLNNKLSIIIICGLQGSGKTTFTAKLAKYLKNKQYKKVLISACDIYRPAAVEQIKLLANKIDVDVYSNMNIKNPIQIAEESIDYAKKNNKNVIIIDTAGRLAIDDFMMNEVSQIKNKTNPTDILFVVDAMMGQDAVITAKSFNDYLNLSGVIISKLDGDSRGGAALSIKKMLNKPILFSSIGENIDSIEIFHPDRIAKRILGMGDVVTLVEKAQEHYNEEEAKKIQRKINKNNFDLDDFLNQIKNIKKMGNVKDILTLIPGIGNKIKNLDIDNNIFKDIEAIICSMTKQERRHPENINSYRKKQIAYGSGSSVQRINELLKQFQDMKKMMKLMNSNSGMNIMKDMMKNNKGFNGFNF